MDERDRPVRVRPAEREPAAQLGRPVPASDPIDPAAPISTARGSVTVAAWTLVSRLTGLLRVVVIGAVRATIRPRRMVDRGRLPVIAPAVVAMLPACGLGWWLVDRVAHGRLTQVLTSAGLGAVAMACFGLTYALLTRQLVALLARARARLPR